MMDQLHLGALTMRSACANLLREVAKNSKEPATRTMTTVYAEAIECLPLPQPLPDDATITPAPGVVGRLLHRGEGVMVCRVTLEPGASWPEETHAEDGETVIVASGAVYVGIGTKPLPIELYAEASSPPPRIKRGDPHTIRNAGATRAEYISVLRRA